MAARNGFMPPTHRGSPPVSAGPSARPYAKLRTRRRPGLRNTRRLSACRMNPPVVSPAPELPHSRTRRRRMLLWSALVGLLVVAQSALVWLTLNYESSRAQEQVEAVSAGVVADVKQ